MHSLYSTVAMYVHMTWNKSFSYSNVAILKDIYNLNICYVTTYNYN